MPQQLNFRQMRPGDVTEHRERTRRARSPVALFLDGVTDQRNIGAIFRLCDAANVEHLYLSGLDDFRVDKKIRRVSRGTTEYVDHTVVPPGADREIIFTRYDHLVALDHTARSVDYRTFQPTGTTLLFIGNEQRGVSEALLARAETHLHLPMLGVKTSMNVACAATVAVYACLPFHR